MSAAAADAVFALLLPDLNYADPSDADVLAMTAHMARLAAALNFAEPDSVSFAVGRLTAAGVVIERLVRRRMELAERMNRFSDEARDEPRPSGDASHDRNTGIALYGEI